MKKKCPQCHSSAEQVRSEVQIMYCRKCGYEQRLVYHVIKGRSSGREIRLLAECEGMIEHLAKCQPDLLTETGLTVSEVMPA